MSGGLDDALRARKAVRSALHLDVIGVRAVPGVRGGLQRGNDTRMEKSLEGASRVSLGNAAEAEEIILLGGLSPLQVFQEVELAQGVLDGICGKACLLHGAKHRGPDRHSVTIADAEPRDASHGARRLLGIDTSQIAFQRWHVRRVGQKPAATGKGEASERLPQNARVGICSDLDKNVLSILQRDKRDVCAVQRGVGAGMHPAFTPGLRGRTPAAGKLLPERRPCGLHLAPRFCPIPGGRVQDGGVPRRVERELSCSHLRHFRLSSTGSRGGLCEGCHAGLHHVAHVPVGADALPRNRR